MYRILNVILSLVVVVGLVGCCCRVPMFRMNVPVPRPPAPPIQFVDPVQPPPIQPPPIQPPPIEPPPPVKVPSDPAEDAVKKLGGFVKRDDAQPGRPVVEVSFNFTKITDADLKILAPFNKLRKLVLTA